MGWGEDMQRGGGTPHPGHRTPTPRWRMGHLPAPRALLGLGGLRRGRGFYTAGRCEWELPARRQLRRRWWCKASHFRSLARGQRGAGETPPFPGHRDGSPSSPVRHNRLKHRVGTAKPVAGHRTVWGMGHPPNGGDFTVWQRRWDLGAGQRDQGAEPETCCASGGVPPTLCHPRPQRRQALMSWRWWPPRHRCQRRSHIPPQSQQHLCHPSGSR